MLVQADAGRAAQCCHAASPAYQVLQPLLQPVKWQLSSAVVMLRASSMQQQWLPEDKSTACEPCILDLIHIDDTCVDLRTSFICLQTSDAFGASQMPNGLHHDASAGPSSMQQQVLQEETAALQQELIGRSRQAHSIEEQMTSLGELMTTFSQLITQQGEQIEQLYYQVTASSRQHAGMLGST